MSEAKSGARHPVGLLQPPPIPKWKWDVVAIDFITNLSKTIKKYDYGSGG